MIYIKLWIILSALEYISCYQERSLIVSGAPFINMVYFWHQYG